MIIMKKNIFVIFLICNAAFVFAARNATIENNIIISSISNDSTVYEDVENDNVENDDIVNDNIANDSIANDSIAKKDNFFKRFLKYFEESNKTKKDKKFDISFIGGPHYATDTKFGIGLVAAGLYKTDRNDNIEQPSNVSLYSDLSTVGFALIGIRGNHLFPYDKYRIDYSTFFFYFPSLYWGVGYENGKNDANEGKYDRLQFKFKADFLFRLTDNLYAGPRINFDVVNSFDFEREEMISEDGKSTHNTSVGFTVYYDTRDFAPNPYKGIYAKFEQEFSPEFLGNDNTLYKSDFKISAYKKVWKGGILAGEFHTQINDGDLHWSMMAKMGEGGNMRGYYDGRYRDKNILDAQIELRQHIYRRNGIAVWVGAANVFPSFKKLEANQTLPNFGVGYRWEFKKRVNVRLDMGFGRDGSGFMFNINEAF